MPSAQLAPKTLATGVVLALLVLLLLTGLFRAMFSTASSAIEQLHDTASELGKTIVLVNKSGILQAELMAMDEAAIGRQFQTGDSASNAIGILQGKVSQLVRESGLRLDSMAAEPPQIKESIAKLTIELKSSGSEAALVRMLVAIESQGTAVIIERLTVIAHELEVSVPLPSSPSLSVEMRICGYWRAPSREKSTP